MAALMRSQRKPEARAGEEAAAVQGQQYLTFVVAGELFAFAIASIKEIIEYRTPTDVPMMPPFMRGVINLRGRVVPVIDLCARFNRASAEVTRRTCIVILEVQHAEERHDIGVVVDTVSAVVEIADADIEPPPSFGAKLRADFIRGMGRLTEKFVIILDTERVLSVSELAQLGELGASEDTGERPSLPAAPAGGGASEVQAAGGRADAAAT